MASWNSDNKVEMKYHDSYGIKNKLRQHLFSTQEDFDSALRVYEILNSQHTRNLVSINSLKSKIQILDHQVMAAKIVKNDFNGRALLADEVGLGKTVEAGILLKEYFVTGIVHNALILTPPSLITQWKEEMKSKFDLDFITNKDNDEFKGYDRHSMLISSLASASQQRNADLLKSIDWDVVVVDEAHRLKNSATKAHKFVEALPKKFLLLLSATPIQNDLEELYNIIELIRPGLLGSWSYFSSLFVADDKARILNAARRRDLQEILSNVIIRTTRNEVKNYIRFTERIPHTHLLTSTAEEDLLYSKTSDFIRTLWGQTRDTGKMSAILPLMILQRQVSSSTYATQNALRKKKQQLSGYQSDIDELIELSEKIKIDTKMKLLQEIIQKNQHTKYLIFTEFIDTQDYIAETLENSGIKVTKFNGSMTTTERDMSVSKFKRDIPVMISTEAGGEGQNFQFCSNVVNYDLPWNPMRVEQRVGRVHRIGQTEDVIIHNFAIKDTIEEYVLELLYEKINLFRMTIGDLDLLFGDEGMENLPNQIFESYMSSKSRNILKNKFSALGEHWTREQKTLNDAILEFDDQVFANFNLSSLKDLK